jgi:hypothetical protein
MGAFSMLETYVFPEVTMKRVSLAWAVMPVVFFGFIAAAEAQHPPSGPQRRDKPTGQFVNYNGQLRWVSPTVLAFSPAPRLPTVSSLGQYERGAALSFLRNGNKAYARPRSTRLRQSNRGVPHAPPVRPAPFLQPRTFRLPQAPQRNYAPTLFPLRS